MGQVYVETSALRRKPPQRSENVNSTSRITERDRELIIRLCEENADAPGATSEVVSDLMAARHGRRVSVDEVDQIMADKMREWRQMAMTLEARVREGLREYHSIPRELRAERAEVA